MTQFTKSHQHYFELLENWEICDPTFTFFEINHFLRYSIENSTFIFLELITESDISISEVIDVDFIENFFHFKPLEDNLVFSIRHKYTKQILSLIIKNYKVILGCHYTTCNDLPYTFQNDILILISNIHLYQLNNFKIFDFNIDK